MLGEHQTYRDHFFSWFPNLYHLYLHKIHNLYQITYTQNQFDTIIETITSSLQSTLTSSVINIIKLQLDSFKILPRVISANVIVNLSPSQYRCYQTITNYLGK